MYTPLEVKVLLGLVRVLISRKSFRTLEQCQNGWFCGQLKRLDEWLDVVCFNMFPFQSFGEFQVFFWKWIVRANSPWRCVKGGYEYWTLLQPSDTNIWNEREYFDGSTTESYMMRQFRLSLIGFRRQFLVEWMSWQSWDALWLGDNEYCCIQVCTKRWRLGLVNTCSI